MEIKTQNPQERLAISKENIDGRNVWVLLHVPNINKSEHYHIELDWDGIISLYHAIDDLTE